MAAEAVLSIQHRKPLDSFRMVVRRFDSLHCQEGPQCRIDVQHAAAEARSFAVPAASSSTVSVRESGTGGGTPPELAGEDARATKHLA